MAAKRARKTAERDVTEAGFRQDVARLNAILGDQRSPLTVELRRRAEAAAAGPGDTELLCWAAGNGRADVVSASLQAGADPNAAMELHLPPIDPHDEHRRWTNADAFAKEDEVAHVHLRPLGAAVHGGHVDVCRVLLDAGADVNADAGDGPPLVQAVNRGHAAVAELLIERGADLRARRPIGHSLLHDAASAAYADVVSVLLKAGADPKEMDDAGGTPIVVASIRGDVRIVRDLIAAGADVDPPAPTPEAIKGPLLKVIAARGTLNYAPPLVHAAGLGHVQVVGELLKAGADLNRTDSHGQTAYDVARRNNHVGVVRLLKEAGAATPGTARPVDLYMAAEAGDVAGIDQALAGGIALDGRSGESPEGLAALLAGQKPQDLAGALLGALQGENPALMSALESDAAALREGAAWHEGMTALMVAAKEGQLAAVRSLLASGAKVGERSTDTFHAGYTALHYAAGGGHVEVMRALLDAGADPSAAAADVLGEPTCAPIHAAAEAGHLDAVRLLLERGANANDQTGGDTPLARAACGGHHEVIRLLLNAGAAPGAPDGSGRTALHNAAANGEVETAKLLLARGVDPNVMCDAGTPIHAAASGDVTRLVDGKRDHPMAVMKVLIDAGGDVNLARVDGETPLFPAAGFDDAVRFLLAHGAEPDARRRDGTNALWAAVAMNNAKSVKLLLEAGADPNAADQEEGQSCLDVAIAHRHRKCRELLEAAGARRAKDVMPPKRTTGREK